MEGQWCPNSKRITEGAVWGQDYRVQTLVHLNSQSIEAWRVKPQSAGCVNTVVADGILITSDYVNCVTQEKVDPHKQEITLCGLYSAGSA